MGNWVLKSSFLKKKVICDAVWVKTQQNKHIVFLLCAESWQNTGVSQAARNAGWRCRCTYLARGRCLVAQDLIMVPTLMEASAMRAWRPRWPLFRPQGSHPACSTYHTGPHEGIIFFLRHPAHVPSLQHSWTGWGEVSLKQNRRLFKVQGEGTQQLHDF